MSMISVIISAYNVAPYIEKCVDSVLGQTYKDLEVIIVNDGSTDNSGEICDRLAEKDKRVIVIHKENGGSSTARNAGIDAARGNYLAFVDGDDYIEATMYEEMLAEMKDESISIVNCGMIVSDITGEERVIASKERNVYSKKEALYEFFARKGTVSPSACNKLYRRSLFENKRFNTNINHEDTEIMPCLLDMSENVVVMDRAFYHYVKRKNSKTTVLKFNVKGYHFLDSLPGYEEMCKNRYPEILPTFHYYELVSTYEMLLRLASCTDCKQYIPQEISLRYRVLKYICKCLKWKHVREKNMDQIKVMLARAVLGVQLTNKIFHLN